MSWPRTQDGSQSAQILDVLAHGGWVTSQDLHRRVFCVLHSRVAALRKRGYVIEHRGEGFGAELHEYRLVGTPLEAPPALVSRGAAAPGTTAAGGASSGPEPLVTSGAVDKVVVSGSASFLLAGEPERAPEILEGQLDLYDALAAA